MKGSPKGDFFRYRAKYRLTDASSRAGMAGPDHTGSGPDHADEHMCEKIFLKNFKKGLDTIGQKCYT